MSAYKELLDKTLREIREGTSKTIVIGVCRGCVNDVKNLPDGWDYIIDDRDE